MRSLPFETWDVFTQDRFAGNPLAVVRNAQVLTGDDMQTIAREFNLAETVFILPSDDPECAARLRIFTPAYEMPFAGHPTVGAAISIATARNVSDAMTLELKAGRFPIVLTPTDGGLTAQFTNPKPPLATSETVDAADIEAALSLPEGVVERGALRPRLCGAGVDYIFAAAPLSYVLSARPNASAVAALTSGRAIGLVLYAIALDANVDYRMRMFAPEAGIPEDPATGSAACALPAHVALGGAEQGAQAWTVAQGVEMGRPSRISLTFEARDGAIGPVSVGGGAVQMQQGNLFV